MAYIPPEKRTKLENVREACRMIGYADSDDCTVEAMAGYKILFESDNTIGYSNDIKWVNNVSLVNPTPQLPVAVQDAPTISEVNDLDYIDDDNTSDASYTATDIDTNSSMLHDQDSSLEYLTDDDIQPSSSEDLTDSSLHDNAILLSDDEDLSLDSFYANLCNITDNSYFNYLANSCRLDDTLPRTPLQAKKSPEWNQWEKAMQLELEAHADNGTWSTPQNNLPSGDHAIGFRWVFTKKKDANGNIERFKARLVAKGYTQKFGIDYTETFSPVIKFKSVRTLMAIAASKRLHVFQDDVKTAFLNSPLEQGMWMHNPSGSGYVYLQKALYGLKQAPLEWNQTFHKFLTEDGWTQSKADCCIYTKTFDGELYYIGFYVDDILTVGCNDAILETIRSSYSKRFKMSGGGI